MKIDIEGAELAALKGMAKILHNPNLRVLLCEIHPKLLPLFGGDSSDVEKLLTDTGFYITYKNGRRSEYHIVCERLEAGS
jgi:folate-dependent phosphoribosylglycinamide formyltransferase PurN